VQANETDPNDGNDTDSETTPVVRRTDLAIDKRDDGSDAVAGTNYTSTLEVTNQGPSDSSGATITDTLPAGWHFVSSTNASCSGDGADPETVTCTVGALVSGAGTSFTLIAAVPSSAVPGTVINTARVQANEFDPSDGNDTDSETTDVVQRTDLAIDKRDDGSNAAAGTNYTYTLEVTNQGPSDSSGATITDTLPAGWHFVSSTNASCSGDGADPETVTCTVGALVSGAGTSFTLTAAVPSSAVPGTVINTARVQANETDPNDGNDTDSETTDVISPRDLAIDKWDDGSDAVAGTNYTYTLEVTNQSPSDSSGATVTDTLPPQWRFASSPNPSCSGDGADPETVTCTIGPLASGTATSFTITAAVPSSAVPGTVTNTAQVQANEPDPNVGNDTDHEETNVVRRTDLAIDKRDDGSDAMAGTNYTYTLEVTNGGPSDSSGATVTDALPAGWHFVASSNASCSGDGADPETVTCTVGPLVSGAATSFTITAAVPSSAVPGTVTNTARVQANEPDPNVGNDTDHEETNVVRRTDLAIDKRDDGSDAVAGMNYTYTLEVTNAGPSDSSGATVTDALPAGWHFVASSNASCSGDGADPETVTCTVGPLVSGAGTSFTITAAVPSSAVPGTVTNTAQVQADEPDPNGVNDTDSEETLVVQRTDLAIDKRDDGSDAVPGTNYTYTLEVTNGGSSDSSGATVTDALPAGWHFVASSNASCSGDGADPETVTCTVGPLVSGAATSFTITAAVPSSAVPGTVTNTAQVQANEPDPNGVNDTDSEETLVVQRTDLAIDKRDDGSDAVAGMNYVYTLEVTNDGPSDSSGATVTDTLPPQWRFISSANASCSGDGAEPETVTCAVGPLAPGAGTSFTIIVAVPSSAAPGIVTNTAQVQANEPDFGVSNDTDSEETNVVRRTDLAMNKRDDGSDATAGMNYTYTLEVMNLGPSDSSGATVTDTLPAGWALVSSSNATCGGDANDPQTVTCMLGPLPIGTQATLTLTVAVPAGALPGTVTNWARVQAHDFDPNAGNNEDSEETAVVPGIGYVSGYVWNDLDGDGLWGAGEPGLNGWTVYVDLNDDGLLQAGEPWFVTQADGQHDGAFGFTNLPLGSHVVREWVPEAWRQTFPAGIDGAHRVASPIQGDFGQTAAPNFGNNLIQVIQFITPLSVLRQDAALPDQRFIRPADDPLTAWQGLNPALLLQDYLDVLAPWQAYPVQNASATTLRYEVTFERHVQSPGDGFLVITDEQLNPLAGDTVTIDIPAGQTRRFFVFYDQPELAPGDQVLRTYPDWYNQPETAVNEALTPAHTFAREDHLLVVTEVRDLLGTIQGESNSYVRLVGASTFDSDLNYDSFVFTEDAQRLNQLAAFSPVVPGDPRWDPTSDINVRFANGAATMPEIGFGDYGALNVEFRRARNPLLDLDGRPESIGVDYVTQYQAGDAPVPVADSTADFANFDFLTLQSLDLRIVHRPDGTNERLLLDAPGVSIEDGGARVIIDRTLERQSIADFQPLLSQVKYENTSPTPTPGPRTILVVAYGKDSTDNISEFCYTWSDADSKTVPASCGATDAVDARTGNEVRTTVLVQSGTSVPGAVLARAAGAPAWLSPTDSVIAPSASMPLLALPVEHGSVADPADLPVWSTDASSRKTELTLPPGNATVPPPGPEGENEFAFEATPIEGGGGMSRIQRTQARDVTRLRVEQLEDRRLLAQYAFAINLYADRGGSPGDLIADDRIQAGEAFFVEITAEDLRTEPQGLEGLGLLVQWDPQVLEEIDSLFDPSAPDSAIITSKFPVFRSGWLDNRAGSIDLLHGMAFSSLGAGQVIGLEGPERFALLHFRAEQTAQDSPITIRPRGVGFVPMREYTSEDLVFEHQTISVLEASSSRVTGDPSEPVEITVRPIETSDGTSDATLTDESGDAASGEQEDASAPAIWQNPLHPYDVDGSNGVTPLDALLTINYLNEHAGDSGLLPIVDGPPPFYYDVNGDHLCTPQDALLVINFLKSAQTDAGEGESESAVGQGSPAAASFTEVPPLATLNSSALPPANAPLPPADTPVVSSTDPRCALVLPWIADAELDDTIDTLARVSSDDGALAYGDIHSLLFADLALALD
jgi:uncharacterized repeat protein (TIGR01451 family)